MQIKLMYIGRYSKAVKIIFDDYKELIIAFNEEFDDPFETEVWEPLILDVDEMLGTLGFRKENKADTELRNATMYAVLPILKELEYKIKACRKAGTITDSLGSFGLSAFRRSVNKFQIDAFHEAYVITFDKVDSNSVALIAKGFSQDKIDQLTDLHDTAWALQDTKDLLKMKISNLSVKNQKIVHDVMEVNAQVMEVLKAYAESVGNVDLLHKATMKAVMAGIDPTPERKPKVRVLKPGKDMVLRTGMNKKNVLQVTLLTDTVVKIGLTALKTDELTTGTVLTHKVMMNLMTKDLMGEGRYVKLRNMDLNKTAKIVVFEVKVVG